MLKPNFTQVNLNDENYQEQISGKIGDDSIPSPEHMEKFVCSGCGNPLFFGIADGIEGKSYHPGCADIERKK